MKKVIADAVQVQCRGKGIWGKSEQLCELQGINKKIAGV
jgi:hypothetical protein